MPDSPITPDTPDLTTLQSQLTERDTTIATLTREKTITDSLLSEHPIDVHATRLLIVESLNDKPLTELPAAIAQLKSAKPWLFTRPVRPATASGIRLTDPPSNAIEQAATAALETGNRTDLLTYLRLRRKK